ncbi:MAG TPA: hypothetical protein VM938_04680 [Acidimicrobiales bacterium]|nr:hypothetical protein [Acidimicrobiales bacterium]
MKRRLALLLAAASIATVGMLAPTSPASANTDVCAGTGTATLSVGFGYPVNTVHVLHPHTANFSFGFTAGTCVSKTSLSASGTVTGYCGLSSGGGATTNGHSFNFTSTGTVLVLTGDVTGTVSAAPDPTHSGSCTNETATRFLITGEVVKSHTTAAPRLCDATTTAC